MCIIIGRMAASSVDLVLKRNELLCCDFAITIINVQLRCDCGLGPDLTSPL